MARKSVGMPSPSGGGGKWAIIAVIATSPIGVFFMVPLVMMLIIGISVSVVSGTTAGMLGTDEVQGAGSGCTIGGTTGQQSDHVRTVIGVAKTMNISKKGAI